MFDFNICNFLQSENFKQIEDIIDARKRLGHYNVYKHTNPLNIRCVYSTFQNPQDRTVKFDEASLTTTDKECLMAGTSGLRHTDSEITVVRVRCTGAAFKRNLNKWDMNDIAIPGDGTHLGESPSMVNLATLVAQNVQCEGDDEYLVPLSSWDPFIRNEGIPPTDIKCSSDSKIHEKYSLRSSYTDPNIPYRLENTGNNTKTQTEPEYEELVSQSRRPSWAGKLSKFWRYHWQKIKSPSEPETTEGRNQNK